MISAKRHIADGARTAPALEAEAAAFLNHLRFVAMACRAKRKTDLFEACALLQVTRTATREAHAEALMRCLSQALGKQARLHAPNTDELTFDEAWLVQVARMMARQDGESTCFLLNSRVAPEHRRLVRYLIARIAESFCLT